MSFGQKGEERIRNLLEDYFEKKNTELENRLLEYTTGIFLTGIFIGILMSYTSIYGLVLGGIGGYTLARQNYSPVNNLWIRGTNIFKSANNILQVVQEKE